MLLDIVDGSVDGFVDGSGLTTFLPSASSTFFIFLFT
jgi:hypothetical protein